MNLKLNHIIQALSLFFLLGVGFAYANPSEEAEEAEEKKKVDSLINARQMENTHIAYGQQPAWMVSGAMATVSGEELSKTFTPSNLGNTLFGRISGLSVQQGSGEPGYDAPTLFGRGVGTYGPGRDMLIMVDGFEVTQEILGQMNPEEIESISFLKDAGATAIYGMRGANGVLLVTTKRGQESKLQTSFSSQVGFQSAKRLPNFLGSHDYGHLFNEARMNDGLTPRYTDQELQLYQDGSSPFLYPDVNWYEETMRSVAPVTNHNVNFSGGNENARYFVLMNAVTNSGLFERSGNVEEESINPLYERYNFRSNLDLKLTNTLSAALTIGGAIEDVANQAASSAGGMFDLISAVPPNAFPVFNPDGSYGGNALYDNPLGNLRERGFYTSNGRMLQSNLRLTQELDMLTEGLSASALLSYNSNFRSFSDRSKNYERHSIGTDAQGDIIRTNTFGQNTQLQQDDSRSTQWRNYAFQAFVNYDRSFGVHQFSGMLMFNHEAYEITGRNNLPFHNLGGGGRFVYAYDQKYIAEASFGYYGSENFAPGNRFGFFPAFSAGWVLSQEGFLQNNETVNFLKVRGSIGVVGNRDIGGERFMFDQFYRFLGQYPLGPNNTPRNAQVEGNIGNPLVTWERDTKFNFGVEATLINNRLDFMVDVFQNKRSDILAVPNLTLPGFVGAIDPLFNPLMLNEGIVRNQGFEAMLRYNSDPSKELKFFMSANTWFARNEIVFQSEEQRPFAHLERTGHPVGQPFLYNAIGFFRDEADITNSPNQVFTQVQPGDIKYEDRTGLGVVDQLDLGPEGKPNYPEFTLGLMAGVQFKGFDVEMLFHGVTGRSVYLPARYVQAFQNEGNIPEMALGRWTPETHDEATYPRLSSQNDLNNFLPSNFWQRDGSFLKLRSFEVGYTFSEDMIKGIGLNYARLFLNGTNLFSFDYVGFTDPETLAGYPAMRTVSIGTRISF